MGCYLNNPVCPITINQHGASGKTTRKDLTLRTQSVVFMRFLHGLCHQNVMGVLFDHFAITRFSL